MSYSCETLADAVAGDVKTGCDAALRMAATVQHPHAAILRHGEQINDSDDSEEKKGHLEDGRK